MSGCMPRGLQVSPHHPSADGQAATEDDLQHTANLSVFSLPRSESGRCDVAVTSEPGQEPKGAKRDR
jgi:hypothetical protein